MSTGTGRCGVTLWFCPQGYLVNWDVQRKVWDHLFGKELMKVSICIPVNPLPCGLPSATSPPLPLQNPAVAGFCRGRGGEVAEG